MAATIATDAFSWPSVERYARGRIEEMRTDLETTSPTDIAAVAGRQAAIAELRALLDAAHEQQPEAPPVRRRGY